jgi:hypothetical protein
VWPFVGAVKFWVRIPAMLSAHALAMLASTRAASGADASACPLPWPDAPVGARQMRRFEASKASYPQVCPSSYFLLLFQGALSFCLEEENHGRM